MCWGNKTTCQANFSLVRKSVNPSVDAKFEFMKNNGTQHVFLNIVIIILDFEDLEDY